MNLKMLEVNTTGTSTKIGQQHGRAAALNISRSLKFYEKIFQAKSNMDWPTVQSFALKYHPYLQEHWPQYVEEMRGVADGAGVHYEDILAMNVRTEIAFGRFSDGCTAISWKSGERSLLGQNWDWNTEQAENLIVLKIKHDSGRSIQMITEAGIIGKIGMNEKGVGCTLNAIKAKGVTYDKLPCHLALRTVLESESRDAAIAALQKAGVASACHILVADATGGTGLECSSEDIVRLEMEKGLVMHTNHYVLKHKESVVEAMDWLPDTRFRLRRIGDLVNRAKEEEPSMDLVERLLKDEVEEDGAAICRSEGKDGLATLFSVVMDLTVKTARLAMGRPTEPTETKTFNP